MYIFETMVRNCKYGTYVMNMKNKITSVIYLFREKKHFVLKKCSSIRKLLPITINWEAIFPYTKFILKKLFEYERK